MTPATALPPRAPERRGWFGATATKPIPRPVYLPLLAMLILFIGANTFATRLSDAVSAAKWVPLCVLLVVAALALRGRRVPQCPPVLFFALMLMLGISATGSYLGLQPGVSILTLLSVVVVVSTGYVVAAVLVVTDSRRAFFDLIGVAGRILLIATTIFYVLRINLGRGSDGFSAWVDNPNTLAAMLAPGMVVLLAGCIERRPQWLVWDLPFLIVGVPMIAVTNGRAGFIWVAFAMLLFWLYRRGSWLTMITFMTLLIILIGWWEPITAALGHWAQVDIAPSRALKAGPLSGREEVWRIGWELFQERPTFGYGFGVSKPLLNMEAWRFIRHQGNHFHSSYLTALVELGIFGFVPFMTVLVATVARGIADGRRTRLLPREVWPTTALPLAMVMGAMGHALFETWLLSAGNVNTPMLWVCIWLVHFQAQIPVRAVPQNRAPALRDSRAAVALPAR